MNRRIRILKLKKHILAAETAVELAMELALLVQDFDPGAFSDMKQVSGKLEAVQLKIDKVEA